MVKYVDIIGYVRPDGAIKAGLEMGLFEQKDIVVQDIRMEKYANIIFDHEIYKNRQIVLDYLTSQGILSIGRFGKWDYLWSHQAFKSGREACQ